MYVLLRENVYRMQATFLVPLCGRSWLLLLPISLFDAVHGFFPYEISVWSIISCPVAHYIMGIEYYLLQKWQGLFQVGSL